MKKLKVSTKISISFLLILLVVAVMFYFLLPNLLNYPPNTINTNFDKEVSKLYYIYQYLIAIFGIAILAVIFFKISLRKVDKWLSNKNSEDINEIRKICFKYPSKLFLIIEVFPVIIVLLTLVCTGSHPVILLFKIGILVFSFATLVSSMFLIISKNIFYPILKETSFYAKNKKIKNNSSLQIALIFQIFPSIIVTVLMIALIGYSRLINEKGELLNIYYMAELDTLEINNEDSLLEQITNQIGDKLLAKKDYIFIETPTGEIITTGELKPSDFFIKYMHELSPQANNRVYEAYTIDEQGVIKTINYNNQEYIVGIHYEVVASSLLVYFMLATFGLLLFNLVILCYIVKHMNNILTKLTEEMNNILEDPDNIDTKLLPLTSNDIIGQLVQAFNEIQEMTKRNIEQIHNNQEILMERERLASLGQLIGGIAHNLRSPIMSIAGATEGLEELIKEYDESIDDPLVNSHDHHEIATEMQNWIPKIRTYTEYMSDIITTVKGQAVALTNEQDVIFTVSELVKRVNILMKHELKNSYINLNVQMKIDENSTLVGDVNNLVQVVDNMISNSIQAYNGARGKNIELEINRIEQNVIITIRDFAGGLPKEVQEKLFKEMVTTKGKNGTGLGLYMSYSNIKAHFGGDITYKTEEGKGTEFNIILPIKQ